MTTAETRTILGHPPGLFVLFFSELWERFCFYGMRNILTLYLTTVMLWDQSSASNLYGWYTMLVYVTSILGGYMADRVLGMRKAIIVGGFLMMLGEFALVMEGVVPFYTGLALLIVGTGFFKPNVSSIVGGLYEPGDIRRDSAFTIFYMGINIGAFVAPLLCGWLAQSDFMKEWVGVSWSYRLAFMAAGVGMIIGQMTFLWGQKHLKDVGVRPTHKPADGGENPPLTGKEKGRLVAIFILALFTIVFWACFEQAGTSLNFWAEDHTHRTIGSFEIPPAWFQSINALAIVLCAPLFAGLWIKLAKLHMEPTTPLKMAVGLGITSLGFLVMVMAANHAKSTGGRVEWWWLALSYFLQTQGELCLSPVGLSMVTKLAPVRFAALMMGVWFVAIGLANKGAATIAEHMSPTDKPQMAAARELGGLVLDLKGKSVEGGAQTKLDQAVEAMLAKAAPEVKVDAEALAAQIRADVAAGKVTEKSTDGARSLMSKYVDLYGVERAGVFGDMFLFVVYLAGGAAVVLLLLAPLVTKLMGGIR